MFFQIIMMFLVNSFCSKEIMKKNPKFSIHKPTNQVNAPKWCSNKNELVTLSFKLKKLFKKHKHAIKADEELNFVIKETPEASFILKIPTSDKFRGLKTQEYIKFVNFAEFFKSKYAYKSTISELIKEINDVFEKASQVKSAGNLIKNSGADIEEDLYN
ncbi:hypothetical protein TUBRATIS_000780 [Tubulinosema ratisbonensis]|uniref:Uncharacterized protein n=1 Tax=Tubulinosema ratisbonensis TaxID=291195 RepID=A0A437AQ77_9MICR|nr:hypothetical protein TUBRATIS_000780 [Tubulinosema ratisbonensis]